MKPLLLCAALVSPLIADEPPPVKGTLCFVAAKQSPSCRSTEGTSIKIAPTETERQFVWSSGDGKTIVAGVLASKADQINIADTALRDVTLSVRGDRRHGWPEDVRMKIADVNKHEWLWTVPGRMLHAEGSDHVQGRQPLLHNGPPTTGWDLLHHGHEARHV